MWSDYRSLVSNRDVEAIFPVVILPMQADIGD
jgi:hypothetical protein